MIMSDPLHKMFYRIAAFIFPGKSCKTAANCDSDTGAVQTPTAIMLVPVFNTPLNTPAGVAKMPTPVLYMYPPKKRNVYAMHIPKPEAAMQTDWCCGKQLLTF